MSRENNFPKLHNAAWPGVVGKGPDSEPPIDLDTMLDLAAQGIRELMQVQQAAIEALTTPDRATR